MAEKLGMDALQVASHARTLSGYSTSLEGIAGDVAQAGFASQNPTLFGLVPGVNLIMTGGSILLAQSAAADVRAALASAAELTGRLFADIQQQIFASSADDGSYILGFLSAADAKALYEQILTDPDVLTGMTPLQISAFWRYLTEEQSDRLWRSYPSIVGNLNGVPMDVRANANQQNAREDLESGNWTTPEHKEYLQAIVDGDIQVVTFDPENHRIVEALNLVVWSEAADKYVLGMVDPETGEIVPREINQVITYVPGTFTTDQSMYEGAARDIPSWLAENHQDAVVFIYKDGIFAGGLNGQADFPTGIVQANSAEFAQATGKTLFEFDQAIGLDPTFVGAKQTAIGHSWGLANIANSEVSGAHYDNVISLAGAWVPEQWIADSGTEYTHHSYTDWLSVLQDAGAVGEGRNPDVTPAFQNNQYVGPNDSQLGYSVGGGILGTIGGGLINPSLAGPGGLIGGYGDDVPILIDNHDLVASTRPGENGQMENQDVLINLEKDIFQ